MAKRRLKHFGWGREGEGMTPEEEAFGCRGWRSALASGASKTCPRRASKDQPRHATCHTARVAQFDLLHGALRSGGHTYGKAYPDYVRGLNGDYAHAPDVVAYPRNDAEVAAVLDWAGGTQAAVTPFGGGSSVVGGVEPRIDGLNHKAAVTIDLREMGQVLEIDRISRAARIQGGVFGRARGTAQAPWPTLRHFPQSFEYSTLGGWIATRSGGHFATLYTHIDDLVESLRVVTPKGVLESRRLPGSGAGPSPIASLLALRGFSGSLRKPGCGFRTGRASGQAAPSVSRTFSPRRGHCGRLLRPASIPRIAASSIPRKRRTPEPATGNRPS